MKKLSILLLVFLCFFSSLLNGHGSHFKTREAILDLEAYYVGFTPYTVSVTNDGLKELEKMANDIRKKVILNKKGNIISFHLHMNKMEYEFDHFLGYKSIRSFIIYS